MLARHRALDERVVVVDDLGDAKVRVRIGIASRPFDGAIHAWPGWSENMETSPHVAGDQSSIYRWIHSDGHMTSVRRWYSKRHSITPTERVHRRQAEDAVQSRSLAIEMRKRPRPVPGRQGVRGSNPRCSTKI
jgi:hypothetical protein